MSLYYFQFHPVFSQIIGEKIPNIKKSQNVFKTHPSTHNGKSSCSERFWSHCGISQWSVVGGPLLSYNIHTQYIFPHSFYYTPRWGIQNLLSIIKNTRLYVFLNLIKPAIWSHSLQEGVCFLLPLDLTEQSVSLLLHSCVKLYFRPFIPVSSRLRRQMCRCSFMQE